MIIASVPHVQPEEDNKEEEHRSYDMFNMNDLLDAIVNPAGFHNSKPAKSEVKPEENIEHAIYKQEAAVEKVNHPKHYTAGGIETIDFIEAKGLNFNLGNVVKYVTRAGRKDNRLEDLKKARWYLDREIRNTELGL